MNYEIRKTPKKVNNGFAFDQLADGASKAVDRTISGAKDFGGGLTTGLGDLGSFVNNYASATNPLWNHTAGKPVGEVSKFVSDAGKEFADNEKSGSFFLGELMSPLPVGSAPKLVQKGVGSVGKGIDNFMTDVEQNVIPQMAGGGVPTKPYYSHLQETIESNPQKAWSTDQLIGFLQGRGVKDDEMKWSGMNDYISSLPKGAKVAKSELLDAIKQPELSKTTRTEFALNPGSQYLTPEVERVARNSSDFEDFMMNINNDEKAYSEIMGKNPKLLEDDDWDLTVAQDIFSNIDSTKGGSLNPRYQKYSTKNVGGNYREEITSLKSGKSKEELRTELKDVEARLNEITRLSEEKYDFNPPKELEDEFEKLYDKEAKIRRNLQGLDSDLSGEVYRSSHWDEPNVLYHVRKQDTTIDGDKTLLIEEIQSDWHQAGRKSGYKDPDSEIERKLSISKQKIDDIQKRMDEIKSETFDYVDKGKDAPPHLVDEFNSLRSKMRSINDEAEMLKSKNSNKIPQAPYSKTWHEKAMKDQIAEAVEKGYDRVAWTTGKTQADRYSLAKQIESIRADKGENGRWNLNVFGKDGRNIASNIYKEEDLPGIVGKEMAQKIVKDGGGLYKGLDLEVGGEGMKGFYDKMLPKWTEKYIKKFGAKLEVKKLSNGQEVWSFPVTDKMKKDISEKGQPLFTNPAATLGAGAGASGVVNSYVNGNDNTIDPSKVNILKRKTPQEMSNTALMRKAGVL